MTSPREYVEIVSLLWPSLASAAALAVSGGVVGVFVLLRRDALLALAVPQAVGVGAAAGLRWGWPTVPPAAGAVALTLGILAWARQRRCVHLVLPAVYISALCLSFLLIANSGQFVEALQNLFTGMDVTVAPREAALVCPVLLTVAVLAAVMWRRWLLLAQAPAVAHLAGLHPARWDGLFLGLLGLLVVLGTDTLGSVMVMVMLFLPAATVLPWVRSIPAAMAGAVAAALTLLAAGFVLSIEMAWPLSQSVGGAGLVLLIGSILLRAIAARWIARQAPL